MGTPNDYKKALVDNLNRLADLFWADGDADAAAGHRLAAGCVNACGITEGTMENLKANAKAFEGVNESMASAFSYAATGVEIMLRKKGDEGN